MPQLRPLSTAAVAPVILALVTACGGGGSSGTDDPVPTGPEVRNPQMLWSAYLAGGGHYELFANSGNPTTYIRDYAPIDTAPFPMTGQSLQRSTLSFSNDSVWWGLQDKGGAELYTDASGNVMGRRDLHPSGETNCYLPTASGQALPTAALPQDNGLIVTLRQHIGCAPDAMPYTTLYSYSWSLQRDPRAPGIVFFCVSTGENPENTYLGFCVEARADNTLGTTARIRYEENEEGWQWGD